MSIHDNPIRLRDVKANAVVRFECLCGNPIKETLAGYELDGDVTTEIHCDDCGASIEFYACLDLYIEERGR